LRSGEKEEKGMKAIFLAVLSAATGAVLHGCGPAGSQPHGGMPPPEVNVVVVKPVSVPVTFEYTGQTAGFREVEVRSRVAGILERRNFEEGARVKKGQSMYTIDAAPFQSALARAEADLASVEARSAQARRAVERLKPLYEAKAASQKEYDDAVSAEQIVQADAKAARARVVDAKLNLGYTRVESPIAGIAGRSERPEGTLVSGPEMLLTVVTQMDPMYVHFGIPDAEHQALRREAQAKRVLLPRDGRFEVSVKLADGSDYPRKGRLGFSDVRINPATGTSEARAQLPNPDGTLRPGQFVRVTLSGATRPNAVLVPQRAVLDGPKGKMVFVVNKESRAEPRPVQVGEWRGDAWIVQSGLAEGDRVIVDGVMKIGPGAPVRLPGEKPPAGGPPQPPQPGKKG
jgi:membrane fusion protein (multidrug efflux system)